jgi:hypothetical protein
MEFAGLAQNPKKKLSEHQINQSERKFFQIKYVSYLKSVKELKIRIRATHRKKSALVSCT